MPFNVSEGAGYAVLYSVLTVFTLLALGTSGIFSCLPSAVTNFCSLKKNTDGTPDYFLSARNSAGVWAIAFSYFASGMGAWILYGTTEMGATPSLSWLGVLGYSGASAFPAILISYIGPMVREMSKKAFSTTDFGRERYGRLMQLAIASISVFYMFIYIVAELTSISNVFALLTNDFSKAYGIGITVSIGLFTILYTTAAGLPASIVTDKFQAVIMGVLVILLLIAVSTEEENRISREEFALASNWTTEGLMAAVTLVIAIASAEMFNQSTWQRVWAAETVPVMRKGFFLGSGLVFFLMMFFGIIGMIAYANDPEAYTFDPVTGTIAKFSFLAFFDLIEPLKGGWHVITLILVTALAASSIDSLQNGLTCVFARDLVKAGWNPTWVIRALMVLVNIPAVWLASKKFDVISLFLVADLVCATSVFPVFLGLQTTDKGFFKAPTELGALLGCISGIVTVLINGVVNDAEGGMFEYFWLRNGAICALCGSKTMISFIITPLMSLIMTYVFTWLDIMVRGERARDPVFNFGDFDEDEDSPSAYEDGKAKSTGEGSDYSAPKKEVMHQDEGQGDV